MAYVIGDDLLQSLVHVLMRFYLGANSEGDKYFQSTQTSAQSVLVLMFALTRQSVFLNL